MNRTTILALGTALLTTGCLDLGLGGNIPEEESEMAPSTELVAAVTVHAPEETLIVDSRPWVPAGEPVALRLEELRAVGSAMGRTAYARSWDQAPYDELFTRVRAPADPLAIETREWQRYVPVLGGGGAGDGHVGAETIGDEHGGADAPAHDAAPADEAAPAHEPADDAAGAEGTAG